MLLANIVTFAYWKTRKKRIFFIWVFGISWQGICFITFFCIGSMYVYRNLKTLKIINSKSTGTKVIGRVRVKYFTLPIGDMKVLVKTNLLRILIFFGKPHKLLAERLKVEKFWLSKSIFCIKNQFLIAKNDLFNDITVGQTFLVFETFHYLHF